MFYLIYELKWKHVMLFEDITNWDTIVNYNNFFRLECRNWLINHHVQLGGFDASGQPSMLRFSLEISPRPEETWHVGRGIA